MNLIAAGFVLTIAVGFVYLLPALLRDAHHTITDAHMRGDHR